MLNFISAIRQLIIRHPAPFALGVVNILAYGVMAPWLGLYGDDWGYIWLLSKGPGLVSFIGASRVGFIPFYQALMAFLGPYPLAWFGYMLLVRWLTSYSFWLVLHKLWPQQPRATLLAALLFAVYPGFYLNSAAVNISMFLVLISFFLFSLVLNLSWLESDQKKWWLLYASLVLAILNFSLAEYFFFMELIRPFIVYIFFHQGKSITGNNLLKTIKVWVPWLVIFLLAFIWRAFFQTRINIHYSIALLEDFKLDPWLTIVHQLSRIGSDFMQSGIFTWFKAVYPVQLFGLPNAPVQIFLIILGVGAVLIFLILYVMMKEQSNRTTAFRTALIFIGLGAVWFLISGWSIWLAKLEITPVFSTTRFTMPFMPGAALIITGLILLLPKPRIAQNLVFALLLAGGIATQLLVANYFRMDWVRQESFFRQLTWRFPGLKQGTTVLIGRNPLENGEENSISAALNWIYSPGNKQGVDYYAYFNPDKYLLDLGGIQPGSDVTKPHLIGSFTANLEQSVALYLDDRNCMRVLYPGLDENNSRLSDFMRGRIPYTRPDDVLQPAQAWTKPALQQVFGREPEHDWCWLYQQSDLLSRSGNWQEIVTLADQYLKPEEYQSDWQKLLVFIEAYARQEEWGKASKLFKQIGEIKPGERAVFCAVTGTWRDQLTINAGFDPLLQSRRQDLACMP